MTRPVLRPRFAVRFLLLVAAAALLLAPGMFSAPASAAEPQRLSVLFITVDDMNCDSVGAFGCEVPDITPNIDRLAAEGLRFEHAHVNIAICMPTRAVWMTGRYPHRSGALGFDRINRDVPTLVEALKDSGYHTGILGKTPHVVPSRHAAFDVIVPATELKSGRSPALYYERCKEFFQNVKASDQPFFLMANAQDPHRPFAGSEQLSQRKGRRRAKDSGGFPDVSRTYRPEEVTVPGFLPKLPDVHQEIAEYYTSVHRADETVGGVLKALEESGLADSTLVVFMSDHGMPLPFAKTNCWRHSTRTPWIVRWPGVVKPGSVDREHMVSGIDFAPTVFDALGIKPLDGMDGRSIVPLLKGETQAGRDYVFTSINRTSGRNEYPMRAVNSKKYGYIFNAWSDGQTRFRNESQNGLTMKAMIQASEDDPEIAARVQHFLHRTPEEFYDYETDPDALKNLIDDPKYQEEIGRFRRLLYDQMQATGDPQLEAFERTVLKK